MKLDGAPFAPTNPLPKATVAAFAGVAVLPTDDVSTSGSYVCVWQANKRAPPGASTVILSSADNVLFGTASWAPDKPVNMASVSLFDGAVKRHKAGNLPPGGACAPAGLVKQKTQFDKLHALYESLTPGAPHKPVDVGDLEALCSTDAGVRANFSWHFYQLIDGLDDAGRLSLVAHLVEGMNANSEAREAMAKVVALRTSN